MSSINPGLILVIGAVLVPLLPQTLRRWYLLALPVVGFIQVHTLADGTSVTMDMLGMTLEVLRVDGLSRVWGYIFNIAAFLSMLFAWHDKDTMQQVSAPIYAGAAIGAVFAGDLVTLFVYWELTAISSVFLIWASRTERAYKTGMRYLLIQVGSGVILLAGVLLWYAKTGSIDFGKIGIGTLAGNLIFIAFGIKCAFPLLHNWLQDAYPEATVTGTVVLSAFTTKLAVYALARGFAGTEVLIYVGATMTAFPIFYAVIENDLRRVLAYSLNNQLGFMVVGIGIGTELSLNGTASHAFSHILYKALLFMSMGAVLFRTGTCKGSELGGLYKSMPWTTGFCIVGAASISAFPLFSGFVSKSMIMTAAAADHRWFVWGVLLFASAGVFHHSGIKIPYFAFFAHDSGKRVKEAPWNMLLAMGLTAFLCIFIGVYPKALYDILPFPVDYVPYTTAHVITQLQLLMFSALAFTVLMLYKIYPPELKSTNLDTDWFYRKLFPCVLGWGGSVIRKVDRMIREEALTVLGDLTAMIERQHGDGAPISKTMQAGTMALIVLSILFLFLIVTLIA
ncbi:MAG: Na(+)/H(+) antiporter subunit D [Rhodospirillales bacterium]|nr:Na(+)/H(+) antiporter subunit D [Rhodospirillales bacterium]